jgi:hypothetical protein
VHDADDQSARGREARQCGQREREREHDDVQLSFNFAM